MAADGFVVRTNDGQQVEVQPGIHYRQVEKGEVLAGLSVFPGHVAGVMATQAGNFSLAQLTDHPGEYIFFSENNLTHPPGPVECHTEMPAGFTMPKPQEYALLEEIGEKFDPDDKVVRVYLECDLEMYQMTGETVQGVYDYVTTIMNHVALVYEVEDVIVQASEIFVWTEEDPWEGSTQIALNNFGSHWREANNNFNGDIAHLLKGFSGGGRAVLDVLCRPSDSSKAGLSGVSNYNVSNFPNYIAPIYVVAHEIGHNLGSPHTQYCAWGPNNDEAIDNCASPEGGNCSPGPPPVNGGTIMSYCNGFNLLNAFGPEPGDLIRLKVAQADCLKTLQEHTDCTIDSVTVVVTCEPDPTPNDPSDNLFTIQFNVKGSNAVNALRATDLFTGQTWTFSYNTDFQLGTFDALQGSRTFTIEDLQNPSCITERVVFPNNCHRPDLCAPFLWETTINGDNLDQFQSVDALSDGSFIAAGITYSDGTGDFPPNQGQSDIFVRKVDGVGNQIWIKFFGGPGYDHVENILALSDGGALVVGHTFSSSGFGTGNHSGGSDGYAMRLDASGNIVWKRLYGGSLNDDLKSVIRLPNGDFILGGTSRSADGDVGSAFGFGDYWFIRINPNGDLLWSKVVGNAETENLRDIKMGHGNTIIACGIQTNASPYYGTLVVEIDFNGNVNWQNHIPSQTPSSSQNPDFILPNDNGGFILFSSSLSPFQSVLDANGNLLSQQVMTNVSGTLVFDAKRTPSGQIVAVGRRYGSSLYPNSSPYTLEYWLRVMDGNGELIWEKTYGGQTTEVAQAVTLTNDGGFVLAGRKNDIVNINDAMASIIRFGPDICSQPGTCNLSSNVSDIQCFDENTPNDTSDDTYTFSVTVTGTANCGTTWTGGGQSGSYGSTANFGPYLIANGNQTIVFSDTQNPSATTSATAFAPSPCSVTPSDCTQNLIQNPGFENGLSGWTIDGTVQMDNDAYSGSYAMRIPTSDRIFYFMPAQQDETYTLNAMLKSTPSGGAGYLAIKFLSSTWQPLLDNGISTDLTSAYQAADPITETAPPNTAYIEVSIYNFQSGSDLLVDDVCLSEGSNPPDPCNPDITSPVITGCPSDITQTTTGNSAIVTWTPPTATDNCTTPTLGSTHQPGSTFSLGETGVVYTAADAYGNPAHCFFTVTIIQQTDPCNPDVTDPVISGCPSDITQTTAGTSAIVNWTPPTATDNCTTPTLGSTHQPGSTFSLGETTVVYTATDAFGNSDICFFTVTVNQQTGGEIDLELNLSQPDPDPSQWGNYEVVATLNNTGSQTATGVKVIFEKPDGVVYVGGNEYDASQGSFKPNSSQVWTVGSIPAGGSAMLTVNYFLLENDAPTAYAQVSAANETDGDSTPGNGTCCTPNEDDEASTDGSPPDPCTQMLHTLGDIQCDNNGTPSNPNDDTWTFILTIDLAGTNCAGTHWSVPGMGTALYGIPMQFGPYPIANGNQTVMVVEVGNASVSKTVTVTPPAPCSGGGQQPDLTLTNLDIQNSPVEAGQVLDFEIDISNQGSGDANGNFTVKSYISTDNTLNGNDIQDGVITTGNYSAGLTETNVPGGSTIPANLADGSYYLIVKVDADDDISESNEGNNTIAAPFTVSTGGGGDIDLSLSMYANPTNPAIYSPGEVAVTVSNNGPQTATGVAISFPKPTGVVYTGGNEYTASQGSFNPNTNEIWTVGSIPSGGSATITVNYFLLTANALTPFAEVSAANETDGDSTPGNGSCCTPSEDDEATVTLNSFGGGGGISIKRNDRLRLTFGNLYPNPASRWVNVEIHAPKDADGSLEFYDQTGRRAHQMDVHFEKGRNVFEVFVSDWRSGVYNLIGRDGGHPAYARFVKVWE